MFDTAQSDVHGVFEQIQQAGLTRAQELSAYDIVPDFSIATPAPNALPRWSGRKQCNVITTQPVTVWPVIHSALSPDEPPYACMGIDGKVFVRDYRMFNIWKEQLYAEVGVIGSEFLLHNVSAQNLLLRTIPMVAQTEIDLIEQQLAAVAAEEETRRILLSYQAG